jgi:hypothetical protein
MSSHVPLPDWNFPGRYNERIVLIQEQWNKVLSVINSKCGICGAKLFINSPCLPWNIPKKSDKILISMIMHYLTLDKSRIYSKKGHTSNYIRTKNGVLTSSCWQIARLSLGDGYFDTLRIWMLIQLHSNVVVRRLTSFLKKTMMT